MRNPRTKRAIRPAWLVLALVLFLTVTGAAYVCGDVNGNGFGPDIITNEAGDIDYPWYWTSTTHIHADGFGTSAVYVCFGRGLGYMFGEWMDVHGAGCQRSDSKDGDFTGYTYVDDGYYFGMAPQGDAARLYNYVRLVRDAD